MISARSILIFGALASLGAVAQQKETLLIGPGDELKIQVFDTPELGETVRVSDQGEIPLALGGSVHVASLTPADAAHVIEQRLVGTKVMFQPHVLVTVSQYATQNVTVFGQVSKPGAYEITTPRPVVDVLTLAGGLTPLADRRITIERHTTHEQIGYYLSNQASDLATQNVLVNPGDTLIVPKAGIVYVLGDVGRPGGYPMTNNESTITALQAVAEAGGVATSGKASAAKIIHRAPNGTYDSKPLALAAMQKGKQPDFPLQPGDVIYVPFSYMRQAALSVGGVAAAVAGAAIYVR